MKLYVYIYICVYIYMSLCVYIYILLYTIIYIYLILYHNILHQFTSLVYCISV